MEAILEGGIPRHREVEVQDGGEFFRKTGWIRSSRLDAVEYRVCAARSRLRMPGRGRYKLRVGQGIQILWWAYEKPVI